MALWGFIAGSRPGLSAAAQRPNGGQSLGSTSITCANMGGGSMQDLLPILKALTLYPSHFTVTLLAGLILGMVIILQVFRD
jgi:hypothetical protein